MNKYQWQVARWSCFLVLCLSFHGPIDNLFGRPKASASQEAVPAIAIRVHNYAVVPAGTLAHAQAEAGMVLLEAGVELRWIDCPLTAADLERYPGCFQHGGLGVIDLNLLPGLMTTSAKQSNTTLGLTPMSKDGERVALAMIFFNLVEAHATALGTSVDRLLGYAIAHEIGHILLRAAGHSDGGIMRAKWTPADMRLASRGRLLFILGQAQQIRAEVYTRTRLQQAEELQANSARK